MIKSDHARYSEQKSDDSRGLWSKLTGFDPKPVSRKISRPCETFESGKSVGLPQGFDRVSSRPAISRAIDCLSVALAVTEFFGTSSFRSL